ncbi:MAG: R3H domain-containing nucleic acid-binding protein [Candidatus Syntrophosphaera sp.]|nr:KH domain-containing protein [Candidatus Cloacimonadota bacterium]MCB5258302.1 KH domain-containing protein [Candidatus Cloacimonadota bacterium]MDD5624606.1 KH domain-containing protein [Candidatus Cloacimonadota bacterium]MDY0111488.1 R3H domain-containing nucleic acid-binding protein [Candidatus Syntrophosphaera sp.]
MIEKSGAKVEELITEFRKEYGLKDWEFKYEIIRKPPSGLLRLFSRNNAVVRFYLPDIDERVTSFLKELLFKMDINYKEIKNHKEGKYIYLEITSQAESGRLIGKNGKMLEALQYLLNKVFEGNSDVDQIYLDVDGYRQRQQDQFLRPFLPIFQKVRSEGKPYTLEPLNAAERRIIHKYIEKQKDLSTLTIGEGNKKRIVIFPAHQSASDALIHSRQQRQQGQRNHKKSNQK